MPLTVRQDEFTVQVPTTLPEQAVTFVHDWPEPPVLEFPPPEPVEPPLLELPPVPVV